MTAVNRLSPREKQQGWLLLAVLVVVLLVAAGAAMLMSQAQLGLRSARQEHQALQQRIDLWPPMLANTEYSRKGDDVE